MSFLRNRKEWLENQLWPGLKAKRGVAGICEYLTLTINQILEAFPAGKVPPVEQVTLRSAKEMEPYLREPESEGWKPVYGLSSKIDF